jgi:hypothetical protein
MKHKIKTISESCWVHGPDYKPGNNNHDSDTPKNKPHIVKVPKGKPTQPVEVLNAGQLVKVLDEWCRKTGLREDNGSKEYGDNGSVYKIEIIGGKLDGFITEIAGWPDLLFVEDQGEI